MTETWDKLKEGVNQVRKITRTVGNHEYVIEYREINGDQFEDIMLRASRDATDKFGKKDEDKGNKLLAQYLRVAMLVSVGEKPYEITMDREMSIWLRKDIDDFTLEYVRGFH
jgi:hypothetical protein